MKATIVLKNKIKITLDNVIEFSFLEKENVYWFDEEDTTTRISREDIQHMQFDYKKVEEK